MPIVQQASGTWTGTSVTPTLPGASSASNTVVLCLAGNVTATTPTNWTLRTSQVAQMGHYWFDRVAASVTSVTVTTASGQGVWAIAEIAGGAYVTSNSVNNTTGAASYTTPVLTPAAGTEIMLASIAGLFTSARTVSGWTNGFVEIIDLCATATDNPMQGVAILDSVTATGASTYSTTATYSNTSTGKSAIIAAYNTTGAAATTAFRRIGKRQW